MTKLILKLVFAVNLSLRLFYFFGDSFCLVHHWRFSASLSISGDTCCLSLVLSNFYPFSFYSV